MSRQSTVKLRVLTAKKSAGKKMEQRSKGLNNYPHSMLEISTNVRWEQNP